MRLTWWHDALVTLRTSRPVDPLLIALGAAPEIEPTDLLPLIDGWEALLDSLPLTEEALALHAGGRGAALFRAAAKLLGSDGEGADAAGKLWALTDLAFRVSDRLTAERALELAGQYASQARLPRPLAILAALARHDVGRGLDRPRRQGSLVRVARAMLAGLTGR
jgi:phytoene synthase